MSQARQKEALEEYSRARRVIFWHLTAVVLSAILVLIASILYFIGLVSSYNFNYYMTLSKNIIRGCSWPVIIAVIIYFPLLLASLKSIEDQRGILNIEFFFGLTFWMVWLQIAMGFFSESSDPSIWISYEMRIYLPYILFLSLLFWLPYLGVSAIALKRARHIQAKYKTIKSWYDTARRNYGTLKDNLISVEARITSLKQELSKHEGVLTQIDKLNMEIQRLVASDPANLIIKANEIRLHVESLPIERVREEKQKMIQEQQEGNQTRKRLEMELNTSEKEEKILRSRLQEIKQCLQELKMVNPANVVVQLQKLRKKWARLNESELENTVAHGEIAQLVKERLILNHRVETKHREIGSLIHQIEAVNQREHILQLKSLILQQKEVNENLKTSKPRLNETKAELERLEEERIKLRAQIYILEKALNL